MEKQWRALVDAVMDFRVTENDWNFLTGPTTTDFSAGLCSKVLHNYVSTVHSTFYGTVHSL